MDKKSDMNSEVYDLFYETFVETLDSFEMNCPVKKNMEEELTVPKSDGRKIYEYPKSVWTKSDSSQEGGYRDA